MAHTLQNLIKKTNIDCLHNSLPLDMDIYDTAKLLSPYSPKYNAASPEIKITEHKRYIDIARSQLITLVHFPQW